MTEWYGFLNKSHASSCPLVTTAAAVSCDCILYCQVGQYLMTLPQQLEPFTMSDNPMLTVALKHGKLPYITTEIGQQSSTACLLTITSSLFVSTSGKTRHYYVSSGM